MAEKNPLLELKKMGQSIWLDYISRKLVCSGQLRRLIDNDGLQGITAAPLSFEKAITVSHDYDADIQRMTTEDQSSFTIYEKIREQDVRAAADEFRELYEDTDGNDGYVSMELNPHLAHDTNATLDEARRVWHSLDRPNVFIEICATDEGLPAIWLLISEGINVNIILISGLSRYRLAAEAYCTGIKMRLADGKPVKRVTSVASFLVSRIDTLVDFLLDNIVTHGCTGADHANSMRGKAAVASATMAYKTFKQVFHENSFSNLADHGAKVQRLLWDYTDIIYPNVTGMNYFDALIAPDTINVISPEILDTYLKTGNPQSTLDHNIIEAEWIFQQLSKLGINMNKVSQQLENESLKERCQAFDFSLLALTRITAKTVEACAKKKAS